MSPREDPRDAGEHEPSPDLPPEDAPDLPAEDDRAVRRLLAEAGGSVATPPDVVARLDDTLAALVAERADAASTDRAEPGDTGAEVVALRRRTRWRTGLLAAAAVVVVGYGVGAQVTGGGLDGADTAGQASVAEDDAGAGVAEEGPTLSRESAPQGDGVVRLRSQKLAQDVARVLEPTVQGEPADRAPREGPLGSCAPPDLAPGETARPASYDGEPAVLVLGPEERGTVVATVYACAGEVLATVLVAAP